MRSETALDVTIEINVKQFLNFFFDILTNEQHSANSS